MARAQRADNNIDCIGKLRAESFLAPSAQDFQNQRRQQDSAGEGGKCSVGDFAVKNHDASKDRDHSYDGNKDQPAKTDCQAGLQQQLIEIDERQPVVAAASQAALPPQLDENALAVGLARHNLEATIDVLSIGRVVVDQQIHAFREHRGRKPDQQVEQVN